MTDAETLVSARLAARGRRTRHLRRRVAALALAVFMAAWLVIYVQLASGHDPALATTTSHRATAVASTSTSASTSASSSSTTSPSTVTTSQS